MANFLRFDGGKFEEHERAVVREAAVTLFVNGERLGSMMVTPERLDEFAVGFLFLEGVIDSFADVGALQVRDDEVHVTAKTAREAAERKYRTSALNANPSARSPGSFGHEQAVTSESLARLSRSEQLTPDRVLEHVKTLNANAEQYRQSGGVHTSALAGTDGSFIVAADVGRHNSIDKIVGHCLRNGIPLAGGTLVTSGRITLEMVHKAARMQVPLIISRTSPTDAAIDLAETLRITIIGYARGGAFNVYTHAERVVLDA